MTHPKLSNAKRTSLAEISGTGETSKHLWPMKVSKKYPKMQGSVLLELPSHRLHWEGLCRLPDTHDLLHQKFDCTYIEYVYNMHERASRILEPKDSYNDNNLITCTCYAMPANFFNVLICMSIFFQSWCSIPAYPIK